MTAKQQVQAKEPTAMCRKAKPGLFEVTTDTRLLARGPNAALAWKFALAKLTA